MQNSTFMDKLLTIITGIKILLYGDQGSVQTSASPTHRISYVLPQVVERGLGCACLADICQGPGRFFHFFRAILWSRQQRNQQRLRESDPHFLTLKLSSIKSDKSYATTYF